MSTVAAGVPRLQLTPGYGVARVVSGCWQLSAGHRPGAPATDADALLEALDRRADSGLTSFDCADIYTGVESLLGRLVTRRRAAGKPPIEIHTKLVPDLGALPTLDRAYVARIVDRSLARLGVERLDLVQLHWWDFTVPGWVEAACWLDELRRAGKLRHIGVTNFDAEHLQPVLDAAVPVVSNQVQYSLLDRRPASALAAQAARHGYHLLVYGSLAGGFLGRRWLGTPAPRAPLLNRSLVKYRLIIDEAGGWDAYQALLGSVDQLAARRGVSLETVAMAWALDQPRVAAAIVGVRDGRHDADHRHAASLALRDAERAYLAAAMARLRPVAGTVYGLEREAGGRHAVIMKTGLNRAAGDA